MVVKAYVMDGVWDPKPGYVPNAREVREKRAVRSDMVYRNLKAGIREVPEPNPGNLDVVIKVGACGVCGSDIHTGEMASDGYTRYAGHLRLPVIMGHEFSGEVVEIGKDVTSVKVGDIVAVEQIRPCGFCDACKTGYFNSCRNIEEVGLSVDGGFSEYTLVPETFCCNINEIENLLGNRIAALEAGALAEPAGVAYNGIVVKGKGIIPGTNVAVMGTGPIGLAAVSIAKASGAAQVFAIDISEKRLEIAKLCGADIVINSAETEKKGHKISDVLLELTHGLGCRTVVETAGAPDSTYPEIVKFMSINANVVVIGRSPNVAPIDLEQFIVKGCSLSGSIGTAGNDIIPTVLRLMASGRIDMRKTITGRFSLDDTQKGIDEARKGGQGKVMISQHYK